MAALDIKIDGISKRFGNTEVLRDISLAIKAGEFVTLLGPSGCGKSTLLRIIAGLERPDRGSLSTGEKALDAVAPKDRDLAFVFQSYALYPHLSVYDNIAAPLVMRELSAPQRLPVLGSFLPRAKEIRQSIDARVRRTSALLKLDALLDRQPSELSGGQQQRVALGRALVREPKIFLMDEPLANLDAGLRIHTRGEIARLHKEMGTTTLFVTHDQAEAAALSDRVAVMFGGEIRQFAPPVELYRNPVDLDVARFLTQPFLNVVPNIKAKDGAVSIGSAKLLIPDAIGINGSGTVAFRPEVASIVPPGQSDAIVVRTVRVEHLGVEAHVFLSGDNGAEFVVRTSVEKAIALGADQTVGLAINPEKAWFFPLNGARQASDLRRAA